MNVLLLFDIDGTLLDTEGAGLSSLRTGFQRAFPDAGLEFPALDLGGATDGSVVDYLFSHYGIDAVPSNRDTFFAAYHESLEETLSSFRQEGRGRVLPGVFELLAHLDRFWAGHVRALLTGNTSHGAKTKLRHFGLDGHFGFGAFGDDHADRNELGPFALRRALKQTGVEFSPSRTVVIGDTPKDIRCARAFGARAVAVATGSVDADSLRAEEPDALLDDFSDTENAARTLREALL